MSLDDRQYEIRYRLLESCLADLLAAHACTQPAYGAPGRDHCAACCYGTLLTASSSEEWDFVQAMASLQARMGELDRLRVPTQIVVESPMLTEPGASPYPEVSATREMGLSDEWGNRR